MSYKVDFDSLDSMYNSVGSQVNGWINELEDIKGKFQTLMETSNMSGSAADSIKSYIENVHMTLIALFTQLVSLHSSNCLLYKQDYQTNIDADLHAVIKSTELSDYKGRIDTTDSKAVNIDDSISYVLSGIKDIFYIAYTDITAVDAKHSSVSRFLSDLDEEIEALEDTHYNNDFINTAEMIYALRTFMNEQTAADRTYRTNFTTDRLASSAAFLQLYTSYVDVTKEYEEKSSAIETAIENESQRVAELQKEYEEIQKAARETKWKIAGICIIGAIVLTAVTGGAGAPLIVGAISAGTSAVMAGANNIIDQYSVPGQVKFDWGSFGKDVLVAGVTGFATGAIGAGIGGAITNKLGSTAICNSLFHSGSGLVRIGTGATIGAVSETSSGIVSRGVGSIITTGDLGEAMKDALDGKDILLDATIGGVGGGIHQYTSTKEAQKAVDDFASCYNEKHNPIKDGEAYGLKNLKETENVGVDFSKSEYILRTETGEPIQVKIKATGDRAKDYRQAEKILKEKYGIDIDFKSMRTGDKRTHVWHHLDDYNVATNETTMQFIDIKAHQAIKTHAGSAKQYHIANGKGYGKQAFDAEYGIDITDEMSTIKGGVSDTMESIADAPKKNLSGVSDRKWDTFADESLNTRFEGILGWGASS